MKALFCIFSGTGNTLRVAIRLADELKTHGVESEIYRLQTGSPLPDLGKFDTIIFGYPVHAFNTPVPMLNFIKNLNGDGKKAYIIRTSGEPLKLNDAAGIKPKKILIKRGFDVLGEFSYVMPYNIIFKHTDQMAARMWRCAQKRISRDALSIANSERNTVKVNVFKRAVSFSLRIEHIAMPHIGKHFKVNELKCIGCGACVSLCPRANIVLNDDDLPTFGKNCVGCMACSFGCPEDAIKISLLNGWKVNGGYFFGAESASDDEICRYCKKSYLNYFHESEK